MTYPDMKRRYTSSLIDVLVVLGVAVTIAGLLRSEEQLMASARALIIAVLVVNYEPILISKHRTIGQWLTGIRVRRLAAPEQRISLPLAYLRTLLKLLLGTLSFFSMGFNKERRALHDLATGSIVLGDVHGG